MIITISGAPGSGKSTIAKMLAKKFKLKHYSMGDLRGDIALKHGMTIDELNKLGEEKKWTDEETDKTQIKLSKKDNFVIDGRLSWYFIPNSIKIFLDVNLREGAKRIFKCRRPDEKEYKNINDVLKGIKNRIRSDKKRYKKYYNVNPYVKKHYDFWLDSTKLTKKEVLKKLTTFIK